MAEHTSPSFQDRITGFLNTHGKVITVVLAVIVVAIIALVVGIEMNKSTLDKEAEMLYQLEQDFSEWEASEDGATETIISIIDEYDFRQGGYFWVRQQFMYARAYELEENFAEAATYYHEARDAGGYLAETALLREGLLLEAAGDSAAAVDVLITLVENFASPEESRVLFTLGRISEQNGDYADASAYYNRLIDEFASSGWSDFAQSRLIALEVDGRL